MRLSDKTKKLIAKRMEAAAQTTDWRNQNTKTMQALGHLVVSDPQLTLVKALGLVVRSTSVEKAGKALLKVFQDNSQELRLMRACIEAEVLAASETEGTLFRRNSVNSVCLAGFARSIGTEYLKSALQPTLEKLGDGTDDYEIDPSRLEVDNAAVPIKNLVNIVARVEELLNQLVSSISEMPPALGFCCSLLSSTAARAFPDARLTAVGGFLMLRFLCPALASPENVGLAAPTSDRRRGLILLSKVMINLSNNVEFGRKEPWMAPLEGLLVGARVKLDEFYNSIVEMFPDTLDADIALPLPNIELNLEEKSTVNLQRLLQNERLMMDLDEMISQHPELHFDRHLPMNLRRALSRCPDLPKPPSSAATTLSPPPADHSGGKLSPKRSPKHSPATSPLLAKKKGLQRGEGSKSDSDVRRSRSNRAADEGPPLARSSRVEVSGHAVAGAAETGSSKNTPLIKIFKSLSGPSKP